MTTGTNIFRLTPELLLRSTGPDAPEQVTQSLIELGLAEPVSGLSELVGTHSLAGAREFAGSLLAQE